MSASVLVLIIGVNNIVVQTPIPSDGVPAGYTLTFLDEFDEQGLNRERWEYRYTGEYLEGVNAEESVSRLRDGFLCLATREHCTHLSYAMTVYDVRMCASPS